MYKIALKNLLQNKKRTFLAVVGLTIAIVGLISLVSLSSGIRTSVEESFSSMEGVTVIEEGATELSSSLREPTAREIERIQGVKVVSPTVELMLRTIDGEKPQASGAMGPIAGVIMGFNPDKELQRSEGGVFKKNLVKGSFLQSKEGSSVLISEEVSDEYDKTVGSTIDLNGETFTIIGIYDTGSQYLDMSYIIPIEKAREMGGLDPDESNFFQVGVNNPDEVNQIAQKIKFKIDDIEAKSASQWSGEFSSIMRQMELFFLGISSIAVLVGAVGIINTMLMSVMERTREFGVLKAMGWTETNIVKLVVLESLFLGIIGGILGIVLGIGLVQVAEGIMPFEPIVTIPIVLGSFLLSVILGLIGGTYPAWKAAKLDPVEAIRME